MDRGSALVVRDAGAGTAFDDTDESHALLTTANYSAPGVAGAAPNYTLLVMPSTNLSAALQASTCYLESASGLVPQNRVIANTTTRGYGGGERLQFEVEGLTKGTNYSSWLVEGNTNGSTRLWLPVSFVTKSGTNCRLLHSLSFCPQVAYSVPSPATLSTASLISYYNTTVTPSLTAFARTLTTFPCDDITMGGYSFVSTCDDCYNSYETWACAIALPRCTDAPSNATLETTDSSSNSSAAWVIPTSYEQLLLRENPAASRTPDFAPSLLSTTFPGLINATETADSETPFPYSEVPPCLDTCQQVGARCPPFIGWGCPSAQIDGGTGTAGYGLTKPVTKGDRMGGGIGGSNMLAGDRYGNVFCNALGTDMISSVQTPTKSAATSSVSTPLWRSLVVAVGSVAGWLLVA
ncbi:hypothetical protein MNV49_005630 [Pseudohyphozyma bogoriensis]|nr:hypothetical protein MNV49_005630 [Pseudohyphozyma bogoriensis]